jgi:hypothetical protein
MQAVTGHALLPILHLPMTKQKAVCREVALVLVA